MCIKKLLVLISLVKQRIIRMKIKINIRMINIITGMEEGIKKVMTNTNKVF
jgi:hypothetical protein